MCVLDKNKTLTRSAVETLKALVEYTGYGLKGFNLSELSKILKSRESTILSFNELSDMGLFYQVVSPVGSNRAGKKETYLLNPKVCADVLVNEDESMIIGKRFYRYDTQSGPIYGGFIEDEGDILEQVKSHVFKLTGQHIDVQHSLLFAVEVTGSVLEADECDYDEAKHGRHNQQDDMTLLEDEWFLESIKQGFMENQMPFFDLSAGKQEHEAKGNEEVLSSPLSVEQELRLSKKPQYCEFGPTHGSYSWQVGAKRFIDV